MQPKGAISTLSEDSGLGSVRFFLTIFISENETSFSVFDFSSESCDLGRTATFFCSFFGALLRHSRRNECGNIFCTMKKSVCPLCPGKSRGEAFLPGTHEDSSRRVEVMEEASVQKSLFCSFFDPILREDLSPLLTPVRFD